MVAFENWHSVVPEHTLFFKFRALLEFTLVCSEYHISPLKALMCFWRGGGSLMVKHAGLSLVQVARTAGKI